MQKKSGLGLALAGGGIRGFAQLGIMQIMEENNIKADFVSGTSIGSIMAVFYASGLKVSEITEIVLAAEKRLKDGKAFIPSPRILFRKNHLDGLVDADRLEEETERVLTELGFVYLSDLKIPTVIPAVDINTGRLVFFTTHPECFKDEDDITVIDDAPLCTVIRASCSIPAMMSTRRYKGMRLADGGLRLNLPVWPLRVLGADKVLAVTMNSWFKNEPRNLIELIARTADILVSQQTKDLSSEADLTVNICMPDINSMDFGLGRDAYIHGLKVAKEMEKDIINLAKPKKFFSLNK